ncbi:FUSC family protein [Actinacidiphila glaucinigra]|uniref:FUSC family protein n=1 Tax=Actinacidiphila glaucinigra TaxID=235986 RepID=UPI0036EADD92
MPVLPRGPGRRPVALPSWLAHPLRWQRGPVPWPAVLRGALAAGPLLALGIGLGRVEIGVLAGLGALFAGFNDLPGTRRTGVVHIGLPALVAALGVLVGAVTQNALTGWWVLPVLFASGGVSGAVSVVGPVCSRAAMQGLAATVIGMGLPLPGGAGYRALWFLAGAGWLLLLRLALRPPRPAGGAMDGERASLARIFDALADALDTVGGPGAEAARRRLSAALDRGDEALRLRRLSRLLLRRPARADELLLAERFGVATELTDAAAALLWEARPLPPRSGDGPRRLARAVRTGAPPGPLPAPESTTPARAAFDAMMVHASLVFARTTPDTDRAEDAAPLPARGSAPMLGRRVLGPVGREYGLKVAVCVTASAAVALALRADHWYWLPLTAAFLVKPDIGPLFSRVVNRCFGTALGVLVFSALAAPLGGGIWWTAVCASVAGALLPFAARHFALQTTAVTIMVLAFVWAGGDTQAALARLADTAIACAIVVVAGHLPRLTDPTARVGHLLAVALRRTRDYLDHVLIVPAGERPRERRVLRRAAYSALGEARVAAETLAAELPSRHGGNGDWFRVVAASERIVDATTACVLRMEQGAPRPSAHEGAQVVAALTAVADTLDGRAAVTGAPELPATPECDTVADVVAELHLVRDIVAGLRLPARGRRTGRPPIVTASTASAPSAAGGKASADNRRDQDG